jgi:hypothetical protein
MKRNLTLLSCLLLLLTASKIHGQTRNDIRFPAGFADVEDVVQLYSSGSCTTTSYDIGSRGKIKFISDLGSNKYLIEVVRNNVNSATGSNYANDNNQFCISKTDYDNKFSDKAPTNTRTAFGFLAVPFKLRFNPTTVAPGGELGGYYGWFIKDSNWIIAPHAGLTFISLNDINSATPENKTGFTFGLALINDVSKNFQIGIVSGVDLFDGADKWTYGYNPWLSVQFGFNFTKSAD